MSKKKKLFVTAALQSFERGAARERDVIENSQERIVAAKDRIQRRLNEIREARLAFIPENRIKTYQSDLERFMARPELMPNSVSLSDDAIFADVKPGIRILYAAKSHEAFLSALRLGIWWSAPEGLWRVGVRHSVGAVRNIRSPHPFPGKALNAPCFADGNGLYSWPGWFVYDNTYSPCHNAVVMLESLKQMMFMDDCNTRRDSTVCDRWCRGWNWRYL